MKRPFFRVTDAVIFGSMVYMPKQIDFLQPGVAQIRHSIHDIDDSYNHDWDVIAELCQNAIDAIRKSPVERGQVSVEVDALEKSIEVIDNGVGIDPNELPALLRPFASGKSHDEQAIGEKGVGLTFVVFSCNDFYIKSGSATGASEGVLRDAYAWKNSTQDTPLLLDHHLLDERFSGTIVRARKIENPCIFNLTFRQLVQVLRTRTALGNTRVLWGKDKSVTVNVRFRDQEGRCFNEELPFQYWLPYEALPANAKVDLEEFRKWTREADRTDIDKRNRLKDKVIFSSGEVTHADQRKIRYVACFVPKRSTWDTLSVLSGICTDAQTQDEAWKEQFGFTRYQSGIFTSVKGMPTGISVEHPSTGYAGYWFNIFILFEDPRLKFDIGRKSIHGRQAAIYREAAKKIFNEYLTFVTKYVSGEVSAPSEWSRDETFAEIEGLVDLNFPGVKFRKKPGDQEASVAAIFFEAIGSGKIRDIVPLCCGYRNKYDLYATWGARKLVIEFKSHLQNITRDFDDAQKMFDELNCIVCWEVTDADIQAMSAMGIAVEPIESSPLAQRPSNLVPHATHKMQLSGFVAPVSVIDLKVALTRT